MFMYRHTGNEVLRCTYLAAISCSTLGDVRAYVGELNVPLYCIRSDKPTLLGFAHQQHPDSGVQPWLRICAKHRVVHGLPPAK